MKNFIKLMIIFSLLPVLSGCKKEDDFLNTKPNQALFVPSTLQDLQSLLNYQSIFNGGAPGINEIASDDYYVTPEALISQSNLEINGYEWAKKVYDAGQSINDWNVGYQQAYYANVVLEYLSKVTMTDQQKTDADQTQGGALFFRAVTFYNLVQTFAMPYDTQTAGSDLGIPLRLQSNINLPSTRATVQACYDQVIKDLTAAVPLLSPTVINPMTPSQPAANAMLARVYLAMSNYSKAYQYADACLNQFSILTDYSTLAPTDYAINPNFLSEDIFHAAQGGYAITIPNYVAIADSNLYRSYAVNDLRLNKCFIIRDGLPYFVGTYDPQGYDYAGLATDEVYLIRAECNARQGNLTNALNDLNTLLVKRWKPGAFIPYTAGTADQALALILSERRKELVFRGLRWTDLRRLNKDNRFALTLIRRVNGTVYSLPPNDPRYAWPIPDNEISTSGIQQNPR